MSFICGGQAAPADALRVLTGLRSCCYGAATDGPTACTSWTPEYDHEQEPPDPTVEPETRAEMCADCAFRPDSPERSGDDRYSHSDPDELASLPHFWCHQGLRKPIRWRHPLGITVEAQTDAYDPPIVASFLPDGSAERVPFKADGSPAGRCAGFATWKRHHLAEADA